MTIKPVIWQPMLAMIAGILFPLSIAPYSYWPLAIISLVIVFALLQANTERVYRTFLYLWLFGFFQFLIGTAWTFDSFHHFGGLSVCLSITLTGLFAAFLALIPSISLVLYQWKLGRYVHSPLLQAASFAVIWWLQEWVRSWLLTGLPWLFAGDSQLNTWLNGWAPIFSVLGLSFITAFSAASVYLFFQKHKMPLIISICLWLSGAILQTVHWTTPIETVQITAVQAAISPNEKWLQRNKQKWIDLYLNISQPHWSSDLVIWPETAITEIYHKNNPIFNQLEKDIQQHNGTLLTGIAFQHTQPPLLNKFHNSLIIIGKGGGIYHKRKLVPFTEYTPFSKQLSGLLSFFNLPIEGFLPGSLSQTQPTFNTHTLAPFICWDMAHPNFVAQQVRQASLLVEISNDAWFKPWMHSAQRISVAQMRALETSKPLVRVANKGISAFINHKGQIINQLDSKKRGALTQAVQLQKGHTPFVYLGLWPLFLISILLLLLAYRKRLEAPATIHFPTL